MKKSRQSIKGKVIAEYGQDVFDNAMRYINKGIRNPETSEAYKLYFRVQQGLIDNVFTIYGIYDNQHNLLYVGRTGCRLSKRWNHHKNAAKTYTSPIYKHMREVCKDNKIDDYFYIMALEEVDHPDTANLLEKEYIDQYQPPYNHKQGGGGHSKLKETRPSTPPYDKR